MCVSKLVVGISSCSFIAAFGRMTFLGGGRACIGSKFAEMEIKQVLSTLVPALHFALPTALDAHGVTNEIYWRMVGIPVPVVRPPHGDLERGCIDARVYRL
ncbi:hypothetical protein C8Q80DRAFT_1138859 [Daedaleopsis nitida]|nr:hypothetical protein C8Q80DRAFT_1138859 [Daedaleopsis nitida]